MRMRRRAGALGLWLVFFAVVSLHGQEARLNYDRDTSRHLAAGAPTDEGLPERLDIEIVAESRAEERLRAVLAELRSGNRGAGEPSSSPSQDGHGRWHDPPLAREAGRWAARHAVENLGVRRYFEAGYYAGLRRAVQDPFLGSRDHRDGLHRGRRDLEARSSGREKGWHVAEQEAFYSAATQVEEQFRQLAVEPSFDPRGGLPPFVAPAPQVGEAELEAVFIDYPYRSFSTSASRSARSLVSVEIHLAVDAWRLYQCRSLGAVYDDRWRDGERAFQIWLQDSARSEGYRDLETELERQVFALTFGHAYRSELGQLFLRKLRPAYAQGYNSGWGYGAFLNAEWSYRRGYHEGFNEAFLQTAEATFRQRYPQQYRESYAELFEEWSTSPKPELLAASLEDGDGDEVFEPGETLAIALEVVNYGGGSGDVPLRIDGRVLQSPVDTAVHLPARRHLETTGATSARIRADARTKQQARISVTLAGQERPLDFRVSYPLEIEAPIAVQTVDTLAGQARASVRVRNNSAVRPASGEIELRLDARRSGSLTRPLDRIGPRQVQEVVFDLNDLHPLDLLAGHLRLEVAARSKGLTQDRVIHAAPARALNLQDRDLLLYLVSLATDGSRSTRDVQLAQNLMLKRLEVDWRVTTDRKGNPYKDDYRNRSRHTAMGDLVQTYLTHRSQLVSVGVFTDLGPRIDRLSKDLPGIHPFLRKSLRRLAGQLR